MLSHISIDFSYLKIKTYFRSGEAAKRLQHCFSPGVIDLVEEKSETGGKSEQIAVVNKSGAR